MIAALLLAAICNCAVCPERQNDFVWENDKVGFRAYGPGEYHRWSGFDIFNKNTSSNVCLTWCHRIDKGNFHENRGYGMDNYTMGASRGVGGIAMFADGEWKTFPDWETSRVIHTGDDYLEFELTYPAFSAAGRMTCRITLRRGEHFFRNDVSFERMPADFLVGPGLDLEPKRDHAGDLNEAGGLVSLFEKPKGEGGRDGSTMAAVFVADPSLVTNITDHLNCCVLAFKGRKNFTYWAGAGWSLADEMTTANAWHGCVRAFKACVLGQVADWPRGKEPATVSRRLSELFLTVPPDNYRPVGYAASPDTPEWARNGYGNGTHIQYAVVSLWVNALDNARLFGDRDLERRLVAAFEPYLGPKANMLRPVKHVDLNVVGAVPLAVARLSGNEKAAAVGLALADFQWREPQADDEVSRDRPAFADRMAWWRQGYSDETRLWIDDMYMINLLQVQAYRLTNDRKYIDRAAKEMCLYLDRIQRPDGLFNHAPDAPFVWGRGAGWMAAGMPMILECLPPDHPCRAHILAGYRKMMATLLRHQRANGLWGQLVDDPESWDETSGSAMFAFGFAKGVEHGWLDRAAYAPAVRRAWLALCDRLDRRGNLSDVCVGTDRKNDRAYYLSRPRITGDPHGQAPMLWLAGALERHPNISSLGECEK